MNLYSFESIWVLDRPCEVVFHVLVDLSSYPLWWPEVKTVTMLDSSRALLRVRAALPYTLRFTLQQRNSPSEEVLEASMTGDLEGWSRWSLNPMGGGCHLTFREEVQVNRPLLRMMAPIARPLMKANHLVMMRRGERGLRRYLSRNNGYSYGVYPERAGIRHASPPAERNEHGS